MALAAGRKHNEADRTETRPEADTGKYVGNRGGSLRHDGLLVTRLYMVQTCVRTLVGADRLEIPLGRRQPRRATKTARIPTITATRMPFYDFTPGIGLKAGMIEADRMRIDRLDRDYHPDYTHGARGTDPQRARHLAKTTAHGRSGSRLTNQRPAGMATAASTHEDLRRPRRKTTGTDTQTNNTESSSQTRPSRKRDLPRYWHLREDGSEDICFEGDSSGTQPLRSGEWTTEPPSALPFKN
jgi:hypothetical protein